MIRYLSLFLSHWMGSRFVQTLNPKPVVHTYMLDAGGLISLARSRALWLALSLSLYLIVVDPGERHRCMGSHFDVVAGIRRRVCALSPVLPLA
jgi:hypothetical protein